ncbi:MAG TPA: spore coat protein [Firmicutes bacterium]|nr:spore coat protein [Bacillota bacterium]
MQLTQKERMLLEDQKKHEEVCIKKYTEAAQKASDPQLKQLFSTYAAQEKQHYQTLDQMLSGQIPQQNTQSGQSAGQGQAMQAAGNAGQQGVQSGTGSKMDADLCNDLLMTEKYVSGTYDTAIFEFTDPRARQVLNHIQKEEQQHGEGIFTYMQAHGMYQPS